jgi:serine/threonine protein kinase
MQLTCPDCQVECTIDEESAMTVSCPGCGLLLYSKSGRSGQPAAQLAIPAGQPVVVFDEDLEKTRQWQRAVDDALPTPELFPQRLGRYELRKKLGEGSFAEVYLAFDSELGREVALKLPRRNRFTSANQLTQFLGEARTAAILEHPGIVRVYDIGWISPEICFISMEHCPGGSLNDRLKSAELTIDQAVELVESLAEAIHFAHLHGFVHRDLKPSNVMFGRDGRPRIVDFGLAISDEKQLSHAGESAGTLPYMSPEQVRGDTHHLDGRTDIWSLGVILYQLLVGRRPFSGSKVQIADQIQQREAKPLRQIKDDVPVELEAICLRCLQ